MTGIRRLLCAAEGFSHYGLKRVTVKIVSSSSLLKTSRPASPPIPRNLCLIVQLLPKSKYGLLQFLQRADESVSGFSGRDSPLGSVCPGPG